MWNNLTWVWLADRATQKFLCVATGGHSSHTDSNTQTNTQTRMHLLTGDSWGSQYELLVNSPKNRMSFRLWARNRRREFGKRNWNWQKVTLNNYFAAPQLASCWCCFQLLWLSRISLKCDNITDLAWCRPAGTNTWKWAQQFVPVTSFANTWNPVHLLN